MGEATIIRLNDVDSTNRVAYELAVQGAAHGTVIQATRQSRGRGRMKRSFVSPPGGLYISIILRPELAAHLVPLVTLAAGVASCQTVESRTGLSLQLKWPNDLYAGDRKLAGILTESAPFSADEGRFPFLVVGIGLNVNTVPEKLPRALRDSATSLYCIQNKRYDPLLFIAGIVERLDTYVANLAGEKEAIFKFWQLRDYLLGKNICWKSPSGQQLAGCGAGLYNDGCYILKTHDDHTKHLIVGGELSLEPSGQTVSIA